MNNKNLGIIMGIIGMIGVAIGTWSLFNSTYITKIGGGDVPTTIFVSIRPDNQLLLLLLIIISLITIVLGIIILLKKRI